MASAMASMASRNVPPPYTIPVGPRVRPPRLLPGTKSANTDPKPNEPPPRPGHIWVQGKWRNPSSNAARDQREAQSIRAEKALRQDVHGMNIYAYSHIRTNQVVYSLTKVMQSTNILSQLLYYGKKTVPAALRRDMWRPYFSIHFSQTPAGAQAGLVAYHRLRELAAQRQLSPPRELLIATEEDVQKAKSKYDPTELKERMKSRDIKNLPIRNQLLPQKLRAKKLMNQKASSVADAAYVIDRIGKSEIDPDKAYAKSLEARTNKYEMLSTRATRRLDRIREKQAAKDAEIEVRKGAVQPAEGEIGLTAHTARRIALEHSGVVGAPYKGMEYSVGNVEAGKRHRVAPSEIQAEYGSRGVEVLWADVRDATWAPMWPPNVYHGDLEPRAAIKHERILAGQDNVIDEDGNKVSEDTRKVVLQGQTTPHVFGVHKMEKWYVSPNKMEEKRASKRKSELEEWQTAKLEQSREILRTIDTLYGQQSQPMSTGDEHEDRLQEITQSHGWLFAKHEELRRWRQHQETYCAFLNSRTEVETLERNIPQEDLKSSEKTFRRLQKIESDLYSHVGRESETYDHLQKMDVNQQHITNTKLCEELFEFIDTSMTELEETTFKGTDVCRLLEQRLGAEKLDDTEDVARLNARLQEHEDDYLADLLEVNLKAPDIQPIPDPQELQQEEEDREKGLEMPPPPKKGIFERMKQGFRRQ